MPYSVGVVLVLYSAVWLTANRVGVLSVSSGAVSEWNSVRIDDHRIEPGDESEMPSDE